MKNPPARAGDVRDVSSVPGSGRSPGEGTGNPPQDSCLENPRDRGACRDIVLGVSKTWTQLKRLSTRAYTNLHVRTPDPHHIPPKVPDKQSDEGTSFKRQARPLGGFSLELAVAFGKSGVRTPPGAWGRRPRPGRVPPPTQGSQETSRIKHPNLSFLVVCLQVSAKSIWPWSNQRCCGYPGKPLRVHVGLWNKCVCLCLSKQAAGLQGGGGGRV